MTTLELHGIYHELAFWQQFVKTDRFLNGWVKKVKTPELNQEVADFILSVKNDSVLDVGSGVCSLLNGLVNVTACDPFLCAVFWWLWCPALHPAQFQAVCDHAGPICAFTKRGRIIKCHGHWCGLLNMYSTYSMSDGFHTAEYTPACSKANSQRFCNGLVLPFSLFNSIAKIFAPVG